MSFLNIQSLAATLVVVLFASGAFFVGSWLARRDRQVYIWIGTSSLVACAGCMLIMTRATAPEAIAIWLSQLLILTSNGLVWATVRAFDGKSHSVRVIMAGGLVWTIAYILRPLFGQFDPRLAVVHLATTAYFAASAYELMARYRQERLGSRPIAAGIVGVHALTSLLRLGIYFVPHTDDWILSSHSPWIGAFLLECILGGILLPLALTILERDRAELNQMTAASTDVLTGTLSRRGFIDQAAAWVETSGGDGALMLFDLDHFKRINDSYGHAAGDVALVAFTRIVKQRLEIATEIAAFNRELSERAANERGVEPPARRRQTTQSALFGRLGGEEFACLLPQISQQQASLVAEDIRRAIASATIRYNGERISMTVSAGVVSTAETGHWLHTMMVAADFALYRAKHNGRDRVEVSTEDGLARARRVVA
ncbi:MAG: GGDEF domain-containing protein [Ancalomicrobiaceae bacterium]|nr:GGDEF domain-containing protein [Ancalomicrobiaceae bacterium]